MRIILKTEFVNALGSITELKVFNDLTYSTRQNGWCTPSPWKREKTEKAEGTVLRLILQAKALLTPKELIKLK